MLGLFLNIFTKTFLTRSPPDFFLRNSVDTGIPRLLFSDTDLECVRNMKNDTKRMITSCAIYPGSFDPFTFGHVNIVKRSLKIFDRIIVAVAINTSKKGTFTVKERVRMLNSIFKKEEQVEVDTFSGLLVDYVRQKGAQAILRGIRTVTDFDYEFQMALANKSMDPNVEQVFMMTEGKYLYYSSSIIKEIVSLGGSAREMVPEIVEKNLRKKLYNKSV